MGVKMKKIVIFNILALFVFMILSYWYLAFTISIVSTENVEVTLFSVTSGLGTDYRKQIINFPLLVFVLAIVGNIYIYKKYAIEG